MLGGWVPVVDTTLTRTPWRCTACASARKSPSPELLNLAAPHFAVESKTRFHNQSALGEIRAPDPQIR